jgi:hypothetical protein
VTFLLIETIYVVLVYLEKVCVYSTTGELLQDEEAKLPQPQRHRGEKFRYEIATINSQ